MNVKVLKVGYLETNCYILTIGNKALIIDPGDDYDLIKKNINGLDLKGILITHHHFDHVGALSDFKDVCVFDYSNLKEGIKKIDEFEFLVIYTKGHTDDSISFYFSKYNFMFVGDFIFKNSIGRTDLNGGNVIDMKNSLELLKNYPLNTIIFPGHGDKTILKNELKNNPFLLNM